MEKKMFAKGGSVFGKKIAVQAADLDCDRIDGTRVYILNLLKYFGKLDPASEFFIYHKNDFNPELTPPIFPNYRIKKIPFPFFWTQLRLASQLFKDQPEVLWMPVHSLPMLRSKKLKTVVTIHDLAFKYFPESFPRTDLLKLNFLTDYAILHADKIIAISESTKKDILKIYPKIDEGKVKVIYHGFDAEIFSAARDLEKEKEVKNKLGIQGEYILYSGAIQPRKNLEVLIEAFGELKKRKNELKLVLAGEKAWLSHGTLEKAEKSPYASDIIMPGKLKFCDLGHLLRGAAVYVFPSLYEGFGIPILESMAAGVPVVAAKNSSLPEVGGDATLYFQAEDSIELARRIEDILTDENLRNDLITKGFQRAKKFSWEKCARETLNLITNS